MNSFIIYAVHAKFKTQNIDMESAFKNAKIFKLRENGAEAFISFRVLSFTGIFISFSRGIKSYTEMPVIEVNFNQIVFGRMKFNGDIRSIETQTKEIRNNEAIDFWIILRENEISLGKQKYESFELLGKFEYGDLWDLNFVGFSSLTDTNWIVEKGKKNIIKKPNHINFCKLWIVE